MEQHDRFVIITPENLKAISEKLSRQEGRILVAEPGPGSYQDKIVGVYLHLFARPLISVKEAYFYTTRGSEKRGEQFWQTGWEDDREYLLRPRPQPSGDSLANFCLKLFERLPIGDYEFSIGFQSTVGSGIFSSKGLSMYVLPGDEILREAFIHGLRHVISQMPEQDRVFSLVLVERMADYAIKDLKNGSKIFKANVSAGTETDIILG